MDRPHAPGRLGPGLSHSLSHSLTLRVPILLLAIFLIGLSPDPASAQPAAELRARIEIAMGRRDWAQALGLSGRLHQIEPNGGLAAYNAACFAALNGEVPVALDWLRKSAEAGFEGVHMLAHDPDLAAARADGGFADVAALVRANRDRGFGEFRELAADYEPMALLPPGMAGKGQGERGLPLIIALHGFGANGADIGGAWQEAAAAVGAILVAPDALRRRGNGAGFEWRFIDEGEWLVLRVLEQMKRRYNIDPDRVVLTGFSQGANLTLYIGARHPDLFRGLIPYAGRYQTGDAPLESLLALPAEERPRVALRIGADDTGARSYEHAEAELRAAGVDVQREVYPGVGHSLPANATEELSEALRWVLER